MVALAAASFKHQSNVLGDSERQPKAMHARTSCSACTNTNITSDIT